MSVTVVAAAKLVLMQISRLFTPGVGFTSCVVQPLPGTHVPAGTVHGACPRKPKLLSVKSRKRHQATGWLLHALATKAKGPLTATVGWWFMTDSAGTTDH